MSVLRGAPAALLCACLLAVAGVARAGAGRSDRQRGEAGAPMIDVSGTQPARGSEPPALRTRPTGRGGAAEPLPDYPRPQLTRTTWLNLNGTWQFEPAAAGTPPPFGQNLSERIVVPFPPESPLSGVGRHYDRMWYRRVFEVPGGWPAPRGCSRPGCPHILIHFGAVDHDATVYVNGSLVARHTGGYDGFVADITRALRPGGPQELVVAAADKVENGPGDPVVGKQRLRRSGAIWYTPSSGIWQTVWIEPVAAAHIQRLLSTPDLVHNRLALTVVTSGGGDQQVSVTAFDGARRVGAVSGRPNRALSLPVPHPKLWSPDSPFLYRLTVSLRVRGQTVDRVGSYFGMRSISVRMIGGEPRLALNGRFTFELGTLDQGYWPDGLYTAPTDAALRHDLAVAKALGFNAVRKHMKVEPDRWYYWADKLGLLVWQDMPALARRPTSATAETQFESELHRIIQGLADHPSIVMWVPFNEGWGEFDPAGIAAYVKSHDPSRLVDTDSGQNCCSSLPDTSSGDVYDSHRYPDPAQRAPADSRAAVDGEFGGLGLFVAGHTWASTGWAYEREPTAAQLTRRYAQLLAEVRDLEIHCGLSGAIYTQAYDVEREVDGLQTYDRAVLKVARSQALAANASVLSAANALEPGTCAASGGGRL